MQNVSLSAFSATNVSANGSAVDVGLIPQASFLCRFTDGAAAGTLKIQGSNDRATADYAQQQVPVNWADIPNASAAITAGGSQMIIIPVMAFQWVRVVWTRSAGAGNVNVDMGGIRP